MPDDCTFPLELAWTFGACTEPPEVTELEGTDLAWIESHCEDGKSLLIHQFRKPRIEAMLCALLEGVQELDDAVWQVLTGKWLDDAVGVQLEQLGEIVDMPRRGWTDETYRLLLSAQILVLRSSGSWPELLAILEAVGVTMSLTEVYDSPPAAGRIVLGEPLDGDVTEVEVFDLLVRAKLGGVRLDLEFPASALAEAFTWADADVDQADTARGWADDTPITVGGYWADVMSTEG